MIRLVAARWLCDHVLRVEFADGVRGEVDLAGQLEGEVFKPLCELEMVSKARYDNILRTVVWPNGADLAPEFLHALLTAEAAP